MNNSALKCRLNLTKGYFSPANFEEEGTFENEIGPEGPLRAMTI